MLYTTSPPSVHVVGILSPAHCSMYNWFVFAAYDFTIYSLFIRNKFDSKQNKKKKNSTWPSTWSTWSLRSIIILIVFFFLIIFGLALAITSHHFQYNTHFQKRSAKGHNQKKNRQMVNLQKSVPAVGRHRNSMSDRTKLLLIIMLNADRFSYGSHSFSSMVLCSSSTDLN